MLFFFHGCKHHLLILRRSILIEAFFLLFLLTALAVSSESVLSPSVILDSNFHVRGFHKKFSNLLLHFHIEDGALRATWKGVCWVPCSSGGWPDGQPSILLEAHKCENLQAFSLGWFNFPREGSPVFYVGGLSLAACLLELSRRMHFWGPDRGDRGPPNSSVYKFSPEPVLRPKPHPSLCESYFQIQSLSGSVNPAISCQHLLSLNKGQLMACLCWVSWESEVLGQSYSSSHSCLHDNCYL